MAIAWCQEGAGLRLVLKEEAQKGLMEQPTHAPLRPNHLAKLTDRHTTDQRRLAFAAGAVGKWQGRRGRLRRIRNA